VSSANQLPLVFYRFDGTYLLITAEMQKKWSLGGWDFTSNPLQGVGGLELPQHNLYEPGLWLVAHLPPSIGPTAAMIFYAALLALSICWVCLRLGMAPLPTLCAAWLGLLLVLPFVYPSLGFDFLWGDPLYVLLIFLTTAAVILFLDLGRGPRRADLARFVGIAVSCSYQFHLIPGFAPVSGIVLGFFGIVALFAAASMRERIVKLVCGIVLAGLAAAVFGRLVYGIYGFAKPTFFWYEFFPVPTSIRDQSFLIASHSRWPAWLVYGLSLLGALHGALRGKAKMRPLARGFLAFVAGTFVLALITERWKGPRIAYIDIFAYPLYCAFAAHAVTTALMGLASLPKLPIAARLGPPLRAFREAPLMGAIVLCALPWLVLIDYAPPPLDRPLVRNLNPFIWPPAETPITKFLRNEIALQPNSPFRGRVASLAGSDFEAQWLLAPFITQHNYDGISLFFSGNDHRMYGLWYYDIPTLFESNQFSSPFFHLMNARLLNAPKTQDLRSYETQSIVNDRVMALLGVRYLIWNKISANHTAVLHYRLLQGYDLYIYAIPDPNVSGYSVTQTRSVDYAAAAIELMADPAINLRDTAIITSSENLPPLVAVRSSSLVVERGGYWIAADSPGTSLLVLPIEYSHCLRVQLASTGAPPPRVLRANVAMAAILFSGHVEGRLSLRYGLFSSACRMEDWRDADGLRLSEARDWPKER
jgi:hypothetical protein